MLSKQYSIHLILLLLLLLACRLASSARLEDALDSPASDGSLFNTDSSGLVWQPLPRATFRPLNRSPTSGPPPRQPPPQPFNPFMSEALAPAASSTDFDAFGGSGPDVSSPPRTSFGTSSRFEPTLAPPVTITTPPPTNPDAPVAITTTPTPIRLLAEDDDEQPTRVPLNRFRPTKPPSVDPQSQPANLFAASGSFNNTSFGGDQQQQRRPYRITNECFECICEASTDCNPNSRCQTSDVRHTRCGMLLISYDQWLETGLSRQLVTREALARDAAADERAFYECVTDRDCAERLMATYMQKNVRDCDKDGRIDCYDVAAIHRGGIDQCNGEALLDSQYWSDFNACFGFGR